MQLNEFCFNENIKYFAYLQTEKRKTLINRIAHKTKQ